MSRRSQLPQPLRPKTKIAKSRVEFTLITLAKVAELGEATPEQVLESFGTKRHSMSQTVTALWDLVALGLVEGHGQSAEYAKGIPATYTVSELGRVVLSWG